MKSNLIKYGIRLLVINFFHYYLKNYDLSFEDMLFTYDARGIVFHLMFLIYGLAAWEIGERLHGLLEKYIIGLYDFRKKLIILGVIYIIYGALTAFGFVNLYFWMDVELFDYGYLWTEFVLLDPDLGMAVFLFYSLVLGFNGIFYYFNHWKEIQLYTQKLKSENIQAKYEALKSQIDPHFFFNSLSVLTSLVYKDPDLSAEYITELSKLYRYILDNREKEYVLLEEEIKYLGSYFFLIKIRFENLIILNVNLSDRALKNIVIPPNTLQMLAENAVKHNRFSNEKPLEIYLDESDDYIIMYNNIDKRKLINVTSGVGLENIRARYELIFKKKIIIEEQNFIFRVKLPKLDKK